MIKWVLESVPVGRDYCLLVNKLHPYLAEYLSTHPDIFPSILFKDFDANFETPNIFYLTWHQELHEGSKIFNINSPDFNHFLPFLHRTPGVRLTSQNVKDIQVVDWEETLTEAQEKLRFMENDINKATIKAIEEISRERNIHVEELEKEIKELKEKQDQDEAEAEASLRQFCERFNQHLKADIESLPLDLCVLD